MSMVSYKSGFFLAYQLLDALYNGEEQAAADSAIMLGDWCVSNSAALDGQTEFTAVYDPLVQLISRVDAGEAVSLRDYNALRAPLTDLLSQWINNLKIKLYLQPGLPSREALCIHKDIQAFPASGDYSSIPDTNEDCVHVLLSVTPVELDDISDKIDVNIALRELTARARFCFPIDSFDYDRLYLAGKLQSLSTNRNDVSIVICGSSYAMVGLKESLMPRPAINLAVNAQDPYFTFLSVKNAKKYCSKIDTVVIAGGYYFWHTDMSDNPSDYYKSVLTRTNYPVLKKLHNYIGDAPPAMQQSQPEPFLEKISDLRRLCEKENNRISLRLVPLEYFNAEFNPRPENGMLRFAFREQNDETNEKAAQARAQAHNGNFNHKHLAENIGELSDFLTQMWKKRVRVIILIPPVTKFYRQFSAPELKETLYELLEPVKKEFNFTFLDLFDSTDFDIGDFQDYDHLNSQGAGKLSKLVAGMV